MTRLLATLLLGVGVLGACGRVGPPVRSTPAPPPSPPAAAAEEPDGEAEEQSP